LMKVFERLILGRIQDTVEQKLIPQQAGFRGGKSSSSQAANLVQHIENGYEEGLITGAVFVDLSAAYDTVIHSRLIEKVYELTNDYQLTRIVEGLLKDRRFYVSFKGKNSRWRIQKNGLPQGSVLAPMLFNIYTNDQPIGPDTQHFIYADDLAVTVQGETHYEVEQKLQHMLERLDDYYEENALNPNPSKTQVCAFHLKNAKSKCKLWLRWRGLENTENPKYLGVTLDRSLTFRKHCENVRAKVETRNSLLGKLVSSRWGARPDVLRTTALALSFSAAEYGCAVWGRSSHTKKVDTALNHTCRIITGCLRPTKVENLYAACGIAPPEIRREVATDKERAKMENDIRHPMFGQEDKSGRLKSRKSFVAKSKPLEGNAETNRIARWRGEKKKERLMRKGIGDEKRRK